ncbi:hypothetical protein L6R52_30650, partial [Myxococcota bacterium]|nr:hypothetical protein [Myxococcota bacterium]
AATPDASEPDASEPDAAEPDAAEPDAGDPCAALSCEPQGRCVITSGVAACDCDAGWRASVDRCVDVDECTEALDTCLETETCTNTDGAFTCADTDECATGADDCADVATCTNVEGGFTCACPLFTTGDGRTCTPNPSVVDVFINTGFAGSFFVLPRQRIGQSFLTTRAGQLAGLEIDLSRRASAVASFAARIEVRDAMDLVVATATLTDAQVPQMRVPLVRNTAGPTFVDLTPFDIRVTAGQRWSILVSSIGTDTCNFGMGACTLRQIGCSSNADCGAEYVVAVASPSVYADGVLLCPNTCGPAGVEPTYDAFIKVRVREP